MNSKGMAMPVVIFTMVVMSVLAVAVIESSTDQAKASRALRDHAEARNVAEVGLAQIRNSWVFDTLSPGNFMDGGPINVGAGNYVYRVRRLDDGSGGDQLFLIEVTGHARMARQDVELIVSTATRVSLGLATEAAATVRGDVDIEFASVTGLDEDPAGWGFCSPIRRNREGLTMADTTQLYLNGATLQGAPPLRQEALTDSTFSWFGAHSWDQLRGMANHTVVGAEPRDLTGCAYPYGALCGPDQVGPRYVGGECDTSHPLNWGSNDPSDPCYGYVPIIVLEQEIDLNYVDHANAMFILDWSDSTGQGAELDIEANTVINGMILGKGCVELQENAQVHGSIFVDGDFQFDACNSDDVLDIHTGAELHYSSCAIERVMTAHGLGVMVGDSLAVLPISVRAYLEPIR